MNTEGAPEERRDGVAVRNRDQMVYLVSLPDNLKSASFLRAVLPLSLHLSWLRGCLPSGLGKHIFNPHVPNRQCCLSLPVTMQDQLWNCSQHFDIPAAMPRKNFQWWYERTRDHLRHLQCGYLYLRRSPQALFSTKGQNYLFLTRGSSSYVKCLI